MPLRGARVRHPLGVPWFQALPVIPALRLTGREQVDAGGGTLVSVAAE